MKKYHISNCGSKLDWMKYFNCNNDIKLVPILDKEFLDDNIDIALKQALCCIMDYLKSSNLEIRNIIVEEDEFTSGGKVKFIIFEKNDQIQGFFKLEEIKE